MWLCDKSEFEANRFEIQNVSLVDLDFSWLRHIPSISLLVRCQCPQLSLHMELYELMCSYTTSAAVVGYLLVCVSSLLYLKLYAVLSDTVSIMEHFTLSRYISVNDGQVIMPPFSYFSVLLRRWSSVMHIGPQQNSLQTRLDRVQYWAKSLQIIVCFTSLTLLFGLWEGHLAHKKSVPLVLCDSVPEQLQKQNWGSGLAGKWPLLLLLFLTLGIKDPKGFGKKLI